MPYLPQLPDVNTYRIVTDVFKGIDRNLRADDGTFIDTTNMSGDGYPVLTTRRPRTYDTTHTMVSPQGMLAKDALVYVDGSSLYYNGSMVDGVVLSTSPSMQPKTLVSMGAYILIWPDKIYVNTAKLSDYGSIEQRNNMKERNVTISLCKEDGTAYDAATVSPTAPDEPDNGDLWIDSSGDIHALFQYDTPSKQWVEIATTYVKIQASGIGSGLNQFDGVTISGLGYDNNEQIAALNGDVIVYSRKNNYIVVVGIIDQTITYTTTDEAYVKVERAVPDMDYICEAQNRIWGCKYGMVNGQTVNEIRCCALGDFRNWSQFLGLSTDSWVASQGTDGQFTGAITHLGYPLFFKEGCLHKVYISSQGAHQVVTQTCRGVQKGSNRSLVVVDELLYYKARMGIMRYDGSLPVCVSDALGTETYYDAVGGGFHDKYYVCMRDASNTWKLYVYDTRTGFWHGDDEIKVLWFAALDDSLFIIREGTGYTLEDINGVTGTAVTDPIEWSATTGIIGLEYPDQKRLSRFVIRIDMDASSTCQLDVQYDSNGVWTQVSSGVGRGLGTLTIPVIPRRCDHMQIRIMGIGPVKVYSFSKLLEMSGDKQ